ncbi:MAG: ferrous iron transport protein B [Terrimicrobiaceae bacterium]|nr:ferrous iron transport protein B [Terrimicrobiaceae bacterium]
MSANVLIATPPMTVALIGNPNTGKTTLFNRLTGTRQRVGNYPGVTVARKTGGMEIDGRAVTVIDLPGAYSLAATSPDERIAIESLQGWIEALPDVVVCLVDATHLRRSLFLARQLADLGRPLIIALNFTDEMRTRGLSIDADRLAQRLGTRVIPIAARNGEGIGRLCAATSETFASPPVSRPPEWPVSVAESVALLRSELARRGGATVEDALLRRMLFEDDHALLGRLGVACQECAPLLDRVRRPIRTAGMHPLAAEALVHYRFIDSVIAEVVSRAANAKPGRTERIDGVLTHRVSGLLIFAGLMFVVFESIYTFATPAMDGIEAAAALLRGWVRPLLAGTPMFQSLVCDGAIAGAGGVIVFLPQIFLLFFFIALLEDTGYLARTAFLMDRLFGWCGLNGKSFVPLLSSYACAVPGVLATRTIEDPKARLLTVLVAPLMSCSARLPVYVLMIGAFIQPVYGATVAALVLFAMHLVGLVVALPAAWFFNRKVLKIRVQPFLLELPPYRMPHPKDVLWRMWEGGREFLKRAGTVILAMSILIWAALYFPRPARIVDETRREFVAATATAATTTPGAIEARLAANDAVLQAALDHEIAANYLEQSFLGRAGKAVQPLFAPAGFDWKITVGVLASFPAREVIVSTLGIIYHLGEDAQGDSLRDALRKAKWTDGALAGRPVFTLATALSVMIFFALCMQCGSTLAVIARESGRRWAVFAFVYLTALAWVAAVLVFQIASRIS